MAWLEAGLPSEGETEEPSHVGRWDETQAAVEEGKSRSLSHRETPISRRFLKLALCEGLFACLERVYSAQVAEAQDEEDEGEHVLEENEASNDRKQWP